MKSLLMVFVLLGSSSGERLPLRAWVSLTKGDRGLGSYFVQIRIDRTMYISRDFCAEAGYLGGPYPAALYDHGTVVQLQAGKKLCKYHVIDTRPYLAKHPKSP
jgi:hypothetical protein